MNPCKKNCSCNICKQHDIQVSEVFKGIDICKVRQEPTPSFGNFFQTAQVDLATNEPMPWNRQGETAGITLDPDTVTIRVTQAGSYNIDYYVNALFLEPLFITVTTALFVNGAEVNPIQTRFGAINLTLNSLEFTPISGSTIVSIPAGGTVQLRNVSPLNLVTAGNQMLAASITLIKLN
ncbi:BclA C-terminal domain-containing protein [Lysinibacillus xylanilyticus]|uniref:BclA C-terminal domain-containing protein n=1 Tax=Lysinibacillus xylanilyticus TaxID=582475 RepID=UPI00380F2A39